MVKLIEEFRRWNFDFSCHVRPESFVIFPSILLINRIVFLCANIHVHNFFTTWLIVPLWFLCASLRGTVLKLGVSLYILKVHCKYLQIFLCLIPKLENRKEIPHGCYCVFWSYSLSIGISRPQRLGVWKALKAIVKEVTNILSKQSLLLNP